MDAKTMVSLLVMKLHNLCHANQGIMCINSRTETQVKKAINNLQSRERCLKDDDRDDSTNRRRLARLLLAYYFAEDTIDTLLIRDKLYGSSLVKWPLTGFRVCLPEFYFIQEIKKFDKVLRSSPFFDPQLETKDSDKTDMKEVNDAARSSTTSLNLGNDAAGEPSQQQRWRRISGLCLEEETNIEGREREIKELFLRLIPEGNGNEAITYENRDQYSTQVIALIGEGGSGKTTLARKLYNRIDVKKHFSKQAWVHIRCGFNNIDVLTDILIQIDRQSMLKKEATLSEEVLMQRITQVLRDSRFFIVIENVENSQVWESFLGKICSSTHRGKIIITTCTADYKVPAEIDYATLHVQGLNNQDSWKLFFQKTRVAKHRFLHIYVLMNQILIRCRGLPLQIVLLSSLFSIKVNCHNEPEVSKPENNIMALSYKELPSSQLKLCLLYMGIFPRGYEIPVRRLIHLWCAEGFVAVAPSDSEERFPKDLAEMYLEELVIRNVIQVVRWRLDGTPKTCRMPGVLYDFLSSKGAEEGFFYHQFNSCYPSAEIQHQFPVRRLAAKVGSKNNIPSSSLHLRSYIAFDNPIRGIPADREINMFLQKIIHYEKRGFGILEVLDLEGVYKPPFPKEVAKQLPLLRYLGLRSTCIESLPDVKFSCLETVDVRHTEIKQLPSSLRPKRHIYLNWSNVNWSLQESDAKLQTLWGVYIEDAIATDFLKLENLQRLGLKCHATSTVEKIADCLPQLRQLHSFKLKLEPLEPNDDKCPHNLLAKMAECSKLQELYLHGKVPQNSEINNLSFPPNLTTLTLSNLNLEIDPMPVLGKLQHLKILKLFGDSYTGDKITCLSGGFPKLLVLKLWSLRLLENWTVEEGAMPCLRALEIRECQSLMQQLPEHLKLFMEF